MIHNDASCRKSGEIESWIQPRTFGALAFVIAVPFLISGPLQSPFDHYQKLALLVMLASIIPFLLPRWKMCWDEHGLDIQSYFHRKIAWQEIENISQDSMKYISIKPRSGKMLYFTSLFLKRSDQITAFRDALMKRYPDSERKKPYSIQQFDGLRNFSAPMFVAMFPDLVKHFVGDGMGSITFASIFVGFFSVIVIAPKIKIEGKIVNFGIFNQNTFLTSELKESIRVKNRFLLLLGYKFKVVFQSPKTAKSLYVGSSANYQLLSLKNKSAALLQKPITDFDAANRRKDEQIPENYSLDFFPPV